MPSRREHGGAAVWPARGGRTASASSDSGSWWLPALAVVLVATQAALAWIAGRITHSTATEVAVVVPLIALVAAPAALGLAAAGRLSRLSDRRRPLALVFATGLLMRLVWIGNAAPVEDDFYRYLWDGAVVAARLDPYAFAPEALLADAPAHVARLVAEGRSVIERINFSDLTSIYPGTAELAFALAHMLAPWRLDGLRVVFVLADATALLLLMAMLARAGRPRALAAHYWCNPLVVLATTATAHVDALLPPLLLAAVLTLWRGRAITAAVLLALATGVKIWPVLLTPLFAVVVVNRRGSTAAARSPVRAAIGSPELLAPAAAFICVTAIVCLPLLATLHRPESGLAAYGAAWANNNAIFAWAEDLLESALDGHVDIDVGRWLRVLSALAAAVLALWVAWRTWRNGRRDLDALLAGCLLVGASVFYLSPAQFPWYALWFLAFAAALDFRPLLLASVLLPVYYLSFPLAAAGDEDVFNFGFALVHALPVLAWCALSMRRRAHSHDVIDEGARLVADRTMPTENAATPIGPRGVGVIIPVRNEAEALPHVFARIPAWVEIVIVADCRSSDGTAQIARSRGAVVVDEPRPGYGRACLSAIAALPEDIDIVVFLDGDASDEPSEMLSLVQPIARGDADLVIGSRTRGQRERGALTPQQMFGNWLACRLLRLFWGVESSDLGPFRAIGRAQLAALGMRDETYGWTIEMQVLAARLGLRAAEVPVTYRRRIGRSKISGTISGVVRAGSKILWVIAREAVRRRPSHAELAMRRERANADA